MSTEPQVSRIGGVDVGTDISMSDLIESTRKSIECDLRMSSSTPNVNALLKCNQEKSFSDKGMGDMDNKTRASKSGSNYFGDKPSATSSKPKGFIPPANWANAPEFVPKGFGPNQSAACALTPASASRSYAQVVGTALMPDNIDGAGGTNVELCPYAMMGECRFGEKCVYLHGIKCEFCGSSCLHPYDPVQREKHSRECVAQHEKDMELSFAVARSSEKTCGICMEVIMEKNPPGEQRFGILPACVHCFCLSCIRKWRQARQFENKIIRACPECRVTSDYVCPSRYWVETKEEKEKLIRSYLESLSKKPCRYYRSGTGDCPFGNKCFYLHALPDGQMVDVGPPRRRVRRHNANGSTSDAQPVSIWEFLEQWELQWFEIEDLMDMMDSDDTSIWSGEDEEDFYDAFEDSLEWDRS